jgi:hypothetical protein
MKAFAVLAAAATASAQVAPDSLTEAVNSIFDKYLPPRYGSQACPFTRISEQCEILNNTVTEVKSCHAACGHGDFKCHLACPKAKPTSVQELVELGSAMACHTLCGSDVSCHRTVCSCPFKKKMAACGKLADTIQCHKGGGNHLTCKLDEDAKALLLQEPWSLVQDVANHVVDYLLPLPAEQQATKDEVRGCHIGCRGDHACHKACPSGPFGILKDQCEALNTTVACHQSCKAQAMKCPFQKMACHMKCPMAMPASVEELKMLADHMACHVECGKDKQCHGSCVKPKLWTEKKETCAKYNSMVACHRDCKDHGHECHMSCPSVHISDQASLSLASPPGNVVKEAVSRLLI